MTRPADLKSLQRAYRKVAALLVQDPAYLPIFKRIEEEIAALEAQNDAMARARAVLAQKATGSSRSRA